MALRGSLEYVRQTMSLATTKQGNASSIPEGFCGLCACVSELARHATFTTSLHSVLLTCPKRITNDSTTASLDSHSLALPLAQSSYVYTYIAS